MKTTIYLDDEMVVALKEAARAEGRNRSDLIRDAIARYLAEYRRPAPRGIGAYASGRSDLSERTEELFGGAIRGSRDA